MIALYVENESYIIDPPSMRDVELSFITSNDHKYAEIKSRLASTDVNVRHIKQSYPEIQAETIRDVAAFSLTTLKSHLTTPFLIEDAGLEINALEGFPGPYSSFVFKTIGWQGILDIMQGSTDRTARFVSIFGLSYNDDFHFIEGICEGRISSEARGSGGFGFDPIFIPNGSDQTYAEMSEDNKNAISHRGRATTKLIEFFEQQ